MNRLTLETIDHVIEWDTSSDVSQLDLGAVRFADPFALQILRLLLLEHADRGHPLDIVWPTSASVRRWMYAMGVDAGRTGMTDTHSPRNSESTLQPITRIEDEAAIGRVVDGFHHRLTERYPLTESSRRALVSVMIELFQNIPHHGNATGTVPDPHGIAAMQDYEDSIFLAVADRGIGLSRSLGLRPGYEGITDTQAVDDIFHRGISRFEDPGRGGELRRIADLVRSWDGVFALRSGRALYYFDPHGGDTYDVPAFPGVQLGLRLPRRVLF